MKTKNRTTRAAESCPVPRDAAEANTMLERIGMLQRGIDTIECDLNDAVAELREDAAARAHPLVHEHAQLTRGLQIWAEANRAALTQDGRSKTVKFAAGEIGWRLRPPSVKLTGVAGVLEALSKLRLDRFIRTKAEPDKEAMLREPDVAAAVPGVAIVSGLEDFVVTPADLTLPVPSASSSAVRTAER